VPANADERRKPRACLQGCYRKRLEQLEKVGQKLGPFLFTRIDLFDAEPAPDDATGTSPGFYVQHVAYPQIDSPLSPQADVWNKLNVRSLFRSHDCEGDDDTDYEIGYANRHMISVQLDGRTYCHGTPHGMYGVRTQNLVLLPTPQPLTEQDVFGPADLWIEKLQKLFWDALSSTGWRPPESQAESVKQNIGRYVIRPDSWLFTTDGLKVSFIESIGGCFACNPRPVTLSWAQVRPLLSGNAVVP
jgi:hypothetical protein